MNSSRRPLSLVRRRTEFPRPSVSVAGRPHRAYSSRSPFPSGPRIETWPPIGILDVVVLACGVAHRNDLPRLVVTEGGPLPGGIDTRYEEVSGVILKSVPAAIQIAHGNGATIVGELDPGKSLTLTKDQSASLSCRRRATERTRIAAICSSRSLI